MTYSIALYTSCGSYGRFRAVVEPEASLLRTGDLVETVDELTLDTLVSDAERWRANVAGSGCSKSSSRASCIDMLITVCSADTIAA